MCKRINLVYLDDSFDKNSTKGGQLSYKEGQEYNYTVIENPVFGKTYFVEHDFDSIGFDQKRFSNHFESL
jgi:hypothetical protein